VTDEGRVAAAAERQRERIEEMDLPAPVSPVKHREATGKLDIEPFEQDDVTEERRASMRVQFLTEPSFLGPGDIGALFSLGSRPADFYKIIGRPCTSGCQEKLCRARRLRCGASPTIADRHVGLVTRASRCSTCLVGLILG